MTLSHVRIVGSGLIGTSIGLALALEGVGVSMQDLDPRAQGLAEDLIKSPSSSPVDLVIFATPIGALDSVLDGEFAGNPGGLKWAKEPNSPFKLTLEESSLLKFSSEEEEIRGNKEAGILNAANSSSSHERVLRSIRSVLEAFVTSVR